MASPMTPDIPNIYIESKDIYAMVAFTEFNYVIGIPGGTGK